MPPKPNKRPGRMAKKGGQAVLQEEINSNEDWSNMLGKPGVYVIDVYTEWCGPCLPMVANLKKIKLELGSENLHYAIAKSDGINALERFRQKSEPHWLFFFDGKMVNLIIGANAPRLMKLITDEVEQYDKFKKGEIQRDFIPMNKVTEEERKKMLEKEDYDKKKTKKEKETRDDIMTKVREHFLLKFSADVQLQTCVVFFPHTISYVMVEKPPEDEDDPAAPPVMVEKRVCEVASACALKYEELMVVEAREVQLTEDTLRQMFFAENEVLESFPSALIDEMLTRKVYSVMVSLPKAEQDDKEETPVVDDEVPPPEPEDNMGLVEQRMCEIIYGKGGSPLSPSPKSLFAENVVVNEYGEKLPSIYTPTNPLSKTATLTVLFAKFCASNGYVEPQPPSPQYLVVFDINKSNVVLPIIEDLEDKVVHYGFFRDTDAENPTLLCKDPELLVAYGTDRVGKDAKMVLSVLRDDKDRSLLRLVDAGPIYVSPNHETGIDDAVKYFPHDFDQTDGEVKTWLAQQQSARDDEESAAAAAEELNATTLGEAEDGESRSAAEEEDEEKDRGAVG